MICPGCGRIVGEKEKFCRYCGADLSMEKVKKVYCAQCGNELSASDIFCGKCGSAADTKPASSDVTSISDGVESESVFRGQEYINQEDLEKTISVEEVEGVWKEHGYHDSASFSHNYTSETTWEEEEEPEEKRHIGLIVLIVMLAFLAIGTTVTAVCLFSDGDNFVKQLLDLEQETFKESTEEKSKEVKAAEENSKQSSDDNDNSEGMPSQTDPESSSQDSKESKAKESNSGTQGNEPVIIDAGNSSSESSVGQSTADYVMPDSSTRYLTEGELRTFSAEQLRIMRNEIYARKGRKFKDEKLQAYFNEKIWYQPTVEADDFKDNTMLNDIERANTKLIRKIEDEKK